MGAACFAKVALETFDVEPEGQNFVAQKACSLKQPGDRTLTERKLEHELAHLLFSALVLGLLAKSKQAKNRKFSLRRLALQMDFSVPPVTQGDDSVTILNVVDEVTGMAFSVVIPTKPRTTYLQAELTCPVLET